MAKIIKDTELGICSFCIGKGWREMWKFDNGGNARFCADCATRFNEEVK